VGDARVPLLRADKTLVCVDDGASPLYNQFAQTSGGPVAWTSAEDMDRADGQYKLGMFVRHNADPAVPGGGSCIFLHIWRSPGDSTSGCTAMDEANLLTLLRWLDAGKSPVLAQFPRSDYERLRTALRLPE
jgi:L,D-peptidoglycan transpeptidase YkuD (ErfK/YbiS/YcfS/YnhG family)